MKTTIAALMFVLGCGALFGVDSEVIQRKLVDLKPSVNTNAPVHSSVARRQPQKQETKPALPTNGVAMPALRVSQALPSKIEIKADHAEATFGRFPAKFMANGKDPDAVQIEGSHPLQSHMAFISYYEPETGRSVRVADAIDTQGVVEGPDTVWYRKNFDHLDADVRYRYGKTTFSQDLAIRSQMMDPLEFGMNGEVIVKLWTEFNREASPTITKRLIDLHAGTGLEPSEISMQMDSTVDFTQFKVVPGFIVIGEEKNPSAKIPVAKEWYEDAASGRKFLIESFSYSALSMHLKNLPRSEKPLVGVKAGLNLELPPRSISRRNGNSEPMKMAKIENTPAAIALLDYSIGSTIPYPSGLVAWWPSEGNANDNYGTNHGTFYTTTSITNAGKVGSAFSFPGATNHVIVNNAPALNPTNGLTIEAWVFVKGGLGTDRVIVSKDGINNNRQYLMTVCQYNRLRGHVAFDFGGGSYGYLYADGATELLTNTWYHLAYTYDPVTRDLSLFVNGQPDGVYNFTDGFSDPTVRPMLVTTEPVKLGGCSPALGYNLYLPGYIDEAAIFDRALGLSEIQQIYDSGSAGKIIPNNINVITNAVGWWTGQETLSELARTNTAINHNSVGYEKGRVAKAFSFNGSSSYLEIPNPSQFVMTTGLTAEAWIYVKGNIGTGTAYEIISKDDGWANREWVLNLADNGRLRAHVWANYSWNLVYFDGNTVLSPRTWYHVALTYDGTTLKAYLNGTLDGSTTYSGTIYNGSQPVMVGAITQWGYPGYVMNGLIDEPTVYDRALTGTEINDIFMAGSAGKGNQDSDGDGITDLEEKRLGLNLFNRDTDGDGIDDLTELRAGLDPLNGSDASGTPNGDGLTYLQKYLLGVDLLARTDSMGDRLEVASSPTNIINIAFQASGTTTKKGFVLAGYGTNDFWNTFKASSNSTGTALLLTNAQGVLTPAKFMVESLNLADSSAQPSVARERFSSSLASANGIQPLGSGVAGSVGLSSGVGGVGGGDGQNGESSSSFYFNNLTYEQQQKLRAWVLWWNTYHMDYGNGLYDSLECTTIGQASPLQPFDAAVGSSTISNYTVSCTMENRNTTELGAAGTNEVSTGTGPGQLAGQGDPIYNNFVASTANIYDGPTKVAIKDLPQGVYKIYIYGMKLSADPVAPSSFQLVWGDRVPSPMVNGKQYNLKTFVSQGRSSDIFRYELQKGDALVGMQVVRIVPPATPTGLRGVGQNKSSALIWSPVAGADGYLIARSISPSGPFEVVGSSERAQGHDWNLVNGTTYYYKVAGTNLSGAGSFSTPVAVTPQTVNGRPRLSRIEKLGGAITEKAFIISYSTLLNASDAADPDHDVVSFRVQGVFPWGTLKKNGTTVTTGVTLLGPGETLVWTPTNNAPPSVQSAFTVVATDGAAISGGAVSVMIQMDAPTTVMTWGLQWLGMLPEFDRPPTHYMVTNYFTPHVVNGLSNVIKVVNGLNSFFAITADHRVYSWGQDASGHLGYGGNRTAPLQIPGLTNIVDIATRGSHTLGLTSEGTVYVWGSNLHHELGIGSSGSVPTLLSFGTNVIKAISAGTSSSFALDTFGNVWQWGEWSINYSISATPMKLQGLSDVEAISAGNSQCLALRQTDHTVWAWGQNDRGQLGTGNGGPGGDVQFSSIPLQVPGLNDIRAISACFLSSGALKNDGTLWRWGTYGFNPLLPSMTTLPERVPSIPKISRIRNTGAGWIAIDEEGKLFSYGDNDFGSLGLPASTVTAFTEVDSLLGVMDISSDYQSSIAVGSSSGVAPTGLSLSPRNQKVEVEWNAYPLATNYTIFRCSDNQTSSVATVTGSIYYDRAVTNYVVYKYFVKANCADNTVRQSVTKSITPMPAPTQTPVPTLTTSPRTVEVSWSGLSNTVWYTVERATSSGGPYHALKNVLHSPVTIPAFSDTQLTNGVTYYYRISPANYNGVGPSAVVSGTPASSADFPTPTSLLVTNGNEEIDLGWTTSIPTNIAFLNIYRSTVSSNGPFKVIARVANGSSVSGYVDTQVDNGQPLWYTSTYFGLGESDFSTPVFGRATNQATAIAVSTLKAISGNGQVYLTWDREPTAEAGYEVYRSSSSDMSSATPLAFVPWYATEFTDLTQTNTGSINYVYYYASTLNNGSTYYYALKTVGFNSSGYSNFQKGEPLASIPKPAIPTLYLFPRDRKMLLQWTNAPGITWSADMGEASNHLDMSFHLPGSVSVIDHLVNGRTYYFQLTGMDTNHHVVRSSIVTNSPTERLDHPAGFTAVPGNAQVALSWTSLGGASGYSLYYTTDPSGSYVPVPGYESGTSFVHTKLMNNITYYYQLCSNNGYEDGEPDEQSAKPLASYAPATPTGLKLASGTNTITFDWAEAGGASSYIVYKKFGTNAFLAVSTNSQTRWVDSSVSAGISYSYQVVALGMTNSGTSSYLTTNLNTVASGPDLIGTNSLALAVSLNGIASGTVRTPTNLVMNASVTGLEKAKYVQFWDNNVLLETVYSSDPFFGYTWINVPEGGHSIRAVAYSATGYAQSTNVLVTVLPENELGYFMTSVTDVQVPVAGLPLGMSRSYDSRNTNVLGMFGYGWQGDMEGIKVTLSHPLHQDWNLDINSLTMNEQTSHVVYVNLPGGQSASFQPTWNREYGTSLGAVPDYYLVFASLTGGDGWLAANDFNLESAGHPDKGSGPTDMVNGHFYDEDISPFGVDGYVYKTSTGTQFRFSSGGVLDSIEDRRTNAIHYSKTSSLGTILYTNALGSKRLTYVISGNLITQIYDPNGPYNSPTPTNYAVVGFAYDGNKDLVAVSNLVDRTTHQYNVTRYTYNTFHLLTEVHDPRGILVLSNLYDGGGRLLAQTDASGFTSFMTNNVASHTATITNGTTVVTTVFDNAGRPTQVTTADGTTVITYDDRGRKATETNPLGQTTRYTYDSQDRVTAVADPLGNSSPVVYNDYGQPLSSSDPNGGTSTFEYDQFGSVITSIDPLHQIVRYKYDSRGNRTNETRLSGTWVSSSEYDGNGFGYMTKSIDAQGNTSSYEYDNNGNRLREIKWLSTVLVTNRYEYDAQNRVTRSIQAEGKLEGQTNVTIYNSIGKTEASTDAYNRTTSFVYDLKGNLIQTVYPFDTGATNAVSRTVTRTVYDDKGRPVFTQDRHAGTTNGITVAPAGTKTIYDVMGRVTDSIRVTNLSVNLYSTNFGGATTYITVLVSGYSNFATNHSHYDALGRVDWSSDPNGHVTSHQFDSAGRQISVTTTNDDNTPVITSYGFDGAGNQTSVTNALGYVTRYEYDLLNRRTKVWFPAVGGVTNSTLTTYDELGQRIAEKDEAGIITGFNYDLIGRLIAVTNDFQVGGANLQVTTYGYDASGNMITQTDAKGHQTIYTYDFLNRRTARILPDSLTEHVAYNRVEARAGSGVFTLQKVVTDFNTNSIVFEHDLADRLRHKIFTNGQVNTDYTYTDSGLRASMQDAFGSTTYTYDSLDRLVQKGNNAGTLYYKYDVLGNVISTTSSTSSGTQIGYTYDSLNRLKSVIDTNLSSGIRTTSYGYDLNGNLTTNSSGNGASHRYTYSEQDRLTNLVVLKGATNISTYYYQLGKAGNRTNITEKSGRTSYYVYDNLYRLTSEAVSSDPHSLNGTASYQYDLVGNRTNLTSTLSGISAIAQQFDVRDWPTNGMSNTNILYDANGNTLKNAKIPYQGLPDTYDAENHLMRRDIQDTNHIQQYGYDGDGNRVAKTNAYTITHYLIDERNPTGYPQVVEEISGTNVGYYSSLTLTKRYTYGHTILHQTTSPTGTPVTSFYVMDGHNNVRFLTDSNGVVTDSYDYDAFGVLVCRAGSTDNNYLYCGEYYDSDLLLYYLRARWMDPTAGRFWTMDSFEGIPKDPATLHKYSYCSNNGVNHADPSGYTTGGEVSTTGAIINTIATRSLYVIAKVGQIALRNPNLVKAFFVAQGLITASAIREDPSQAYLYFETGGFAADLALFNTLKNDVRGAIAFYKEADALGRSSGVFAKLTKESLVKGSSASVEVNGANWGDGLARGHLLAKQLGGDGVIHENLTPIYQSLNNSEMKAIENRVRSAVEGGEEVYYRVNAIFEGESLVPKYIKIEAKGNNGTLISKTFENKK